MHAFDRRADRQPAKRTYRILIARPRLHSTQGGKNDQHSKITVIMPFKVIQGYQFWYQSKVHMQLPISDC